MKPTNLPTIVAACAAGFLGGTVASRVPMQAASPEVVRASRFELLDAAGGLLARWEADPKTKEVRLRFIGKNGVVSLDIGVRPGAGPFFSMNGRDGKERIAMSLGPLDKPALGMSDERWLGRVVLGYTSSSDTPDIPSRLPDEWGLTFSPFGTTRAVAAIGMTNAGGGETKGVLVVNGEAIRK